MSTGVRPASAADIDSVVAIERASFPDPWSTTAFSNVLENPAITFLVAIDGGEVAGYIIAWIIQQEGEIANLAVAPSRRRRGIAGRLLDSILDVADGTGCRAVLLEVRESNAAARLLYASRRFQPLGRRRHYYHHPVEDAIILGRNAPDARAGTGPR